MTMDQEKKSSPFEDVSLIIGKITSLAEENQKLSFENQSLKAELQNLQTISSESCGGDADGARVFDSITYIAYLAYKMEAIGDSYSPRITRSDGSLRSPEEYLERIKQHIRKCDSYPNPYNLQKALLSTKITVDEYVDFVKIPALTDYYKARSKWEAEQKRKQEEEQKNKENEENKEEEKEE